ncbi:coiled-coil-helix-coiled-coil-helix domain containing 4 [Nesidiocoris tenuis]|uniref:Coiled-coil-helix-coiled-coil-helix domain containing 4 n=1 Tax=Nesidiocoris tenuis TaxID=355587 RepID=A0ABN7BG94_9HEMI|nr:coiled-coil-helix-coiled-coil-helix domain containing 4 [Nesidiocoris tenuis]
MGGVAASSPVAEESPEAPAGTTETNKLEAKPDSASSEGSAKTSGEPLPQGDLPAPEGEPGEERPGLILDDGTINWDCPCLGGMAYGPCGDEFRAAFSCFHYSTAEQKGSDCLEPFMAMQSCFQKYPELFGPKLTGEDEEFDESALPPDASDIGVEDEKEKQKQLSDSEKNSDN